MDLLYLYPDKNDAPAKVGKSILKELINYLNILPFDTIKLIVDEKNEETKQYGLETITFSEVFNYPNNYILHIPISPNVMPNKKFLLNIYSLIKRKPLILHYHGDFRRTIWIQLKNHSRLDYIVTAVPSAIFVPYILKNTNQVITHSYYLNSLIENSYDVKNSIIIPNGVDDFWFHPLENYDSSKFSHMFSDNFLKIFFHGRLASEKGVDLLIKAVAKFLKENPNTKLYLAGEGEEKENLIELCEKLKIKNNVFFLGNLESEALKYFLENVDAAIYPSRFDAFCLAVMEAFAGSNCPVYFSRNAGIYDFVVRDDYQLKFFEPTEDNIMNILNSQLNTTDDVTDESIVISQKDFARKYKWNLIIKEYINMYWELYKKSQ